MSHPQHATLRDGSRRFAVTSKRTRPFWSTAVLVDRATGAVHEFSHFNPATAGIKAWARAVDLMRTGRLQAA